MVITWPVAMISMAAELNVEQSTYSRYESGKTRLPLEIIKLIIEKYAFEPHDFLDFLKKKAREY